MGILSRFRRKDSDTTKAAALTGPAVTPAVPAVQETGEKGKNAWRVLVRPLVSEKASGLSAYNQYVFVVSNDATKASIRDAVREIYGVTPTKISVARVRGRSVRYGRSAGKTKGWKKAVVTLPEGKKIKVYEGV